jgi:replicative DNA helicase
MKIGSPVSEQALLASIIRSPDKFVPCADIVSPIDFSWACYGWVWEAAQSLSSKGLVIDALTLGDELEREGKLKGFQLQDTKQFTGRTALSQLREIHTTDAAESYAMTVHDYSAKRQVLGLMSKGAEWAQNGRSAADIVSDVTMELGKLTLHNGRTRKHTYSMDIATINALEASEAASRGEKDVETGLTDLDKLLSPQKTELIVIAARPGIGKSAFVAGVAVHAAEMGKRVKLFTAEMGATQVTQRLISLIAGVSAFKFMKGALHDDEWTKIHEAVAKLQDLPIIICDLPEIKIGQIRTECRRDPIDLAILDYIQLANADAKNDRRDLDIGEVTRGCKGIAKELDIPFFAAAQVGRAAEGREPTLADLRESGSIENDADSVVFIHRDPFKPSSAKLIVGKHRNGPVGFREAYFDEETISFKNSSYEFTPRVPYGDN